MTPVRLEPAAPLSQVKYSTTELPLITVDWEIFARVLFLRNFAYAKFRENEALAKWRDHSVIY